jgi:hypothetical protein
VRILADIHISPRTVTWLEVLPVVEPAAAQGALISAEDALVRTRNLPVP